MKKRNGEHDLNSRCEWQWGDRPRLASFPWQFGYNEPQRDDRGAIVSV